MPGEDVVTSPSPNGVMSAPPPAPAPRQRPPMADRRDQAIMAVIALAVKENAPLWFSLIATTALAAYAVAAVPGWWKLAGAAGYAILVYMPVLHRVWHKA